MPRIDKKTLAYIIGVALGDGNLSNPNGRAVRLRVTCDTNYPNLIEKIISAIEKLLPENKVSIIKRAKTYIDISCYSNKWEGWLGWKAFGGSKYKQKIHVPGWIKTNKTYSRECLRGLLETDGSIYLDRGYKMTNFVTIIPTLAKDAMSLVEKIGFGAKIYKISTTPKPRYNIRVSRNVDKFIKAVGFKKT